MAFFQDPPKLGNTFDGDALLREHLARTLPGDAAAATEAEARTLGELAAGRLFEMQLAERHVEPRLVQWDAWGRRIDLVEETPLWREARVLAARHGLVATAYESARGPLARVHQ